MEHDSSAFGYFFEAVEQLHSAEQGFAVRRIMEVPWAWQTIDRTVCAHGWVIQFWDGRRMYVEYIVDEACDPKPTELILLGLAPGENLPELRDRTVHWFVPRHVNVALGWPTQWGVSW